MAAVLFVVRPRKRGFLAACERPTILALGSSAEVAAENALLAARTVLGRMLPAKVIVRVEQHGSTTIAMQKTNLPINLDGHTQAERRSKARPTADA